MKTSVVVLEPARRFLQLLEPKLRAKAYRTLALLEELGSALSFPHSRKIIGTEKLYELRIKQASNICRLFYFQYGKELYVVLSGFVKKTDKTDRQEIERAIRFMNEYLEEKNE